VLGYPILCIPIISFSHLQTYRYVQLTSSNPKKEVMRSLCSFGCNNDTGITGAGGGIVGGCVGLGGTFRLI
jgi:hypothetical protein